MKLETIFKGIAASIPQAAYSMEISGITADSRQVKPGYLFFVIRGREKNGAEFMDDAATRGAVCFVVENETVVRKDAVAVRVDNPRRALALAASNFFGAPSKAMLMFGITGTNGKTTTAFMLRDIMIKAGMHPGLIGTVEYQMGARTIPASRTTPDAVSLQYMLSQMLINGAKGAALEVSSHALDQERTAGICFDAAIFTNLSRDHLDYHPNMEEYFAAKAELFTELPSEGKASKAIINIDDAYGARLASMGLKVETVKYGTSEKADVVVSNIQPQGKGMYFEVKTPWGSADFLINMPGVYNVMNAVSALSAACVCGFSFDVCKEALESLTPIPGRLEPIAVGRGFDVYVDYAHTDDALRNVMSALRHFCKKRLILVFGCGGNRDKFKRAPMGRVASEFADWSVITSDNPRKENPESIIADILEGFSGKSNYIVEVDRASAIEMALNKAEEGDLVLIAGKGHEQSQEFANRVVPFDDRKIARKFFDRCSGGS